MTLYAGVDGGQSSTVAVIGDAERVLGRGVGPPCDLVGRPRDPAHQAAAVDAAIDAALASARLDVGSPLEAVVAGLSGFDAEVSAVPELRPRAARVRVLHDATVAHAAALGGAPGIVVIAGTGSVALGNAAAGGPFERAGGWGYFFGDEGSAIWIARTALRAAMRRRDAGEGSALEALAIATFGARSLRDVQHAFAHGELGRATLAAFAADVLAQAEAGDADAERTRGAAAAELAALAALVDARCGPAEVRAVSYAGGCFADAPFARAFGLALAAAVPRAELRPPACEPAAGALALARSAA